MVANYAGITTTLLYEVSNEITDEVTIRGIDKLDIKIGDYLQIDEELVRVKTTVPTTIASTDAVYVFRGVLGTKASRHVVGSVVRRVSVTPIEFRRHSIIRASGHTFEYVGFGPGNYSTALPDKQDRQISAQEELLSQSTRREGGINFYTGMNDKGISYSGNKKLSTVTGQEEIFDTPIQTVTGDDIGNQPSLNVINPVEGNFSRSIKVEGGFDGEAISEFNGPVIFGDKVTSTSTKGFEVNSLFLQGNTKVSRKYTIGESAPTDSGNPGDVQYNANPSNEDYLGWVYTNNNQWRQFGRIGNSSDTSGVVVRASGVNAGFSTLINFDGTNITIIPQTNSNGITTLRLIGVGATDLLSGNTLGGSSGNRWDIVPLVSNTGTIEIGKVIDFHNSDTDTSDFTYRLDNTAVGILSASGSLSVNNNIDLNGELNFTNASDKYVDFYTNDGASNYVVYLRLVNNANTTFHNGITMSRGGAVTLFHNDSAKLATSSVGITVTGDINSASDINLKTNVREIENSLNKVLQIRGVNFDWKESGRTSSGVIAQEIEKVLPELVSGDETKVVNYNGLIGVLIEAVKEQQRQIDELKKLINN